MNKIITCLFVVALSCCIQTTIAQAHNNTDSLTEKFFTLYKTTGPDVALDFLFHTNDYFTKENESVDDVKTKLARFVKSGGAYHGYDFIIKKMQDRIFACTLTL